ncbi:NAD-dependent epimerase/dehydratase family protein [Rubrivirga marina]|uniref:NAD-dependent epimerase/dehydratase family protein n=1 Tax=Rubrivirga marina TaxID=1196024 RepID=UPI001C52CF71|nr:NAD(P)H-binding protein [Rubrivirga marina]
MAVSILQTERPAPEADAAALSPAPEAEPPETRAEADRPTVAIAGASGFVGTALRHALAAEYDLVGLTRSPARAARTDQGDATHWRHCDLFSLRDIEEGLDGADLAVYLVHSMLPSARLTQGTFADLDLILADNFSRAAKKQGVKQIVYLSGLLPEDTTDLSKHLRSRWEVERTLAAHGVPVTTLRTGLVVGKGGSSLRILVNLVRRLPAMVLPSWTESDTQPVALRDVVRAVRLVLGAPGRFEGAFDVAGPDVMTYREMLEQTAEVLGVERPASGVPILTPKLSTLWVSLVTGSPRALVGPLVASLRHDMVVRDNPVQRAIGPDALPFQAALREAVRPDGQAVPDTRHGHRREDDASVREARLVRSVQRFDLPEGRTAEWAGREYMRWLDGFAGPLLRVRTAHDGPAWRARFSVRPFPRPVLELTHAPDRSTTDRALFYVTGGMLAQTGGPHRGRLEFREVLGGACLLAAIHDFAPRLPWALYRLTQAVAHLFVMAQFGRHLSKLANVAPARLDTKAEAARA